MKPQAIIGNLTDAANTERDIDQLIAWHDRQRAVHDTAIATLMKSKAYLREVTAQMRLAAGSAIAPVDTNHPQHVPESYR